MVLLRSQKYEPFEIQNLIAPIKNTSFENNILSAVNYKLFNVLLVAIYACSMLAGELELVLFIKIVHTNWAFGGVFGIFEIFRIL
jgi:hypothetical protein